MRNQMKNLFLFTFFMLFITSSFVYAQGMSRSIYVKVPEENLRSAPNGKKLGALSEGTEMSILVEKGDWVKVQITGWIWKASLTASKPASAKGQLRALHILVETREEADAVLKLIESGKDFTEVAKNKSTSPSAVKGGDLGYFNKGDFDPSIENAIQSLQVDQVSGIVETSFGFNIFKRIK
jgi:foldase protein PrsA